MVSRMDNMLLIVCFLIFSSGNMVFGQSEFDYGDEHDQQPQEREFMIPHPRLGRHMDYAFLKYLYSKDPSRYGNTAFPFGSRPDQPTGSMLRRDLRETKAKTYGVPVPRVGKRSIEEENDVLYTRKESIAQVKAFLEALLHSRVVLKYASPVPVLSKANAMHEEPNLMPTTKFTRNWAPVPRVG